MATYDALFADMTWGKMTSEPLVFLGTPETESNLVAAFGYHFLAGIRRPSLAVMGGVGFQSLSHSIGDTQMSMSVTPVVARAEFGRRRKIVLMGFLGSDMLGGRLEVPLFRRLNVTAMYWQADGTATPWDTGTAVPAKANMLMLGVRTAETR